MDDSMERSCANCHYWVEVLKSPTFKETLTHVCAYHIVEYRKAYVLETLPNEMCEEHFPKIPKN